MRFNSLILFLVLKEGGLEMNTEDKIALTLILALVANNLVRVFLD